MKTFIVSEQNALRLKALLKVVAFAGPSCSVNFNPRLICKKY
jgi:hypothetical protein